jgi:hypothetical protein
MFDIIVRLIMSLTLIWMGLNLFLEPRVYKAFAGNIKGPINRLFARFPDWVITGLGGLLILAGVCVFVRLVVVWHPVA